MDGRERNINTLISYLPHAPQPRTEPTTWVCAPTGNGTHHLLVYGTALQPSHTDQGLYNSFNEQQNSPVGLKVQHRKIVHVRLRGGSGFLPCLF